MYVCVSQLVQVLNPHHQKLFMDICNISIIHIHVHVAILLLRHFFAISVLGIETVRVLVRLMHWNTKVYSG